jgi:hypothetical protein
MHFVRIKEAREETPNVEGNTRAKKFPEQSASADATTLRPRKRKRDAGTTHNTPTTVQEVESDGDDVKLIARFRRVRLFPRSLGGTQCWSPLNKLNSVLLENNCLDAVIQVEKLRWEKQANPGYVCLQTAISLNACVHYSKPYFEIEMLQSHRSFWLELHLSKEKGISDHGALIKLGLALDPEDVGLTIGVGYDARTQRIFTTKNGRSLARLPSASRG